MEVNQHICKLLQQRESVCIPAFGTVKAHYAPATIHPAQHLFQPPHKTLSFEKKESTDDGLLIHFIARSESIPMQQAADKVRHFVDGVNRMLKEKGDCFLEGLGKFYFDIEKHLNFLPDNTHNFLLASYGLTDFISLPVLRPENIQNYASKGATEKKKRRFIWFRF